MINDIKLALLGGDKRQLALGDYLASQGYKVTAWGICGDFRNSRVCIADTWENCICGAKAIILALPASSDGVRINCPLLPEEEAPKFSALIDVMGKKCSLVGGRFSPHVKCVLEEKNIKYFDYFESEELQLRNALPTAEGAVSIAMQELDITLFGSKTAVVGYGRIGKILASLLRKLGSDVTVLARKSTDLVKAGHCGCRTLKIEYRDGVNSMEALSEGYDVIFNTVPYWLFDDSLLRKLDKHTFIIDLASAPGGVDIRSARENGIKVNWALSLPGKYAPVTAGEMIGKTIIEILTSEEVTP